MHRGDLRLRFVLLYEQLGYQLRWARGGYLCAGFLLIESGRGRGTGRGTGADDDGVLVEASARLDAFTLADDDARARLRQLPAFDPSELTRAVGFVRVVRRFVALPLLVLGVLATGAAMVAAHPVTVVVAAVVTFALQWSLRDDMRLAHAFDLARRGRIAAAERRLLAIATCDGGSPGRQRARVVLAAIAWQRGRLEQSLAWIREALACEPEASNDPDRLFELAASEVMLLALLGRPDDAAARLAALPPAHAEIHRRWRIHIELLTAFVRDDVSTVAVELDGWSPIVAAHDSAGPTAALLAWAYAAIGQHDEAARWTTRARAGDEPHLLRHRYHALAAHLDTLDHAPQWSRR